MRRVVLSISAILGATVVLSVSAFQGCPDFAIQPGVSYDARPFLDEAGRATFASLYPSFDEKQLEKDWEWKDVDPLGMFSPAENRARRRSNFLIRYSPDQMPNPSEPPLEAQLAFKASIEAEIPNSRVQVEKHVAKIVFPYTERYDKGLPACRLMDKLSTLGIRWATAGGTELNLYNGSIYLGTFESGWLSFANLNIDQPPLTLKMRPHKDSEEKGAKRKEEASPI